MRFAPRWRRAAAVIGAGWALACGGGDKTPGETGRSSDAAASAAGTAAGAPSPCVLAERWEACYVEKRLENSGLVPQLVDSAEVLPMFAQPARHYRLGRGELYVMLYADSAARVADLATVDSLTVSRRGAPRHAWPMLPYLVVSGNAAAVLLTTSEHLTARIDDLFTGGLPTLKKR